MANDYDCLDGRFCFVQWEKDQGFVCCVWRTHVEALKESLFSFLSYCPQRLVVLKVVNVSLQEELILTKNLDSIAPSSPFSPWWRPNNALLQQTIRDLPCHSREARFHIGYYQGRLLWRPGQDSSISKTAREVILETLERMESPTAPASLQRLSTIALPRQTIYNTLTQLYKEGLVYRPNEGLYALTQSGLAFCHRMTKEGHVCKGARSLKPGAGLD